MAEYEIVINYDRCTACRICEEVCSINRNQAADPQKSMIRIVNLKKESSIVSIPVRCMQCENPICQVVCPTGAISTNLATGARVVDKEKCIGCSSCVFACPFGAVTLDRFQRTAVMCNLCDGDPLCAKWCPFEAIQYVRNDEISIRLKKTRVKKLLETFTRSSVNSEKVGKSWG